MIKSIWVVIGETGEYSYHQQWIVIAYTKEKQANDHAEASQKFMDALGDPVKVLKMDESSWENPYDSQCRIDYNGTKYHVQMVLLNEAFELIGGAS